MWTSRRQTAEVARKAFELILEEPNGLSGPALLQRMQKCFPSASLSTTDDCGNTQQVMADIVRTGSIAPLRAGWLTADEDAWRVTQEGRVAYYRFRSPEEFLFAAGKLSNQAWLAVRFPGFYSLASKIKDQTLLEYRLIQQIGLATLLDQSLTTSWKKLLPVQAPQTFEILGVHANTAGELQNWLTRMGLEYKQGGHTIYLPPASIQNSDFAILNGSYPPDFGIKILKNPGGPNEAAYLFGPRRLSWLHRKLIYRPPHLTLVSNLLFQKNLGPRLHDLAQLRFGDETWTCFVLEHIAGRVPSISRCNRGIARLRSLQGQGILALNLPEGWCDEEFRPPRCNGNAFVNKAGEFKYIDFQNFLLCKYADYIKTLAAQAVSATASGFASGESTQDHVDRGRHLLVEMSSDSARTRVLKKLLQAAAVTVADQVVLELNCGLGVSVAQYLRLGAAWCHGWGCTELTCHAEQLLSALGCTRFSISCIDRQGGCPSDADLPDFIARKNGYVVSISGPVPAAYWDFLLRVPWSALIYEEDGNGDVNRVRNVPADLPAQLAGVETYTCEPEKCRTLALFVRGVAA
jgi:hypothetical protein